MRLKLLYFGPLRDRFGSEAALDAPEACTVGELRRRVLGDETPAAVAVNMEYAGPETPLREGDEVAFIPPVAGGRP